MTLRLETIGARVLAWLVLAGPALPAGSAAEGPSEHVDQLVSILRDAPEADALARIADLGPEAGPAVWAMLCGRIEVEPPLKQPEDADLLRAGLARWAPTRTLEVLLDALEQQPGATLAQRLVLTELIARTDCDAAVAGVFGPLADIDRNRAKSRAVRAGLKRSLVLLLEGRPHRINRLHAYLPDVPPSLLPCVVKAASRMPYSGAVRVLVRAASLHPAVQRDVLLQLGEIDRILDSASHGEAIELARSRLESSDPQLRRLAVTAVGRLWDTESFGLIIERLDDVDEGVRRAANAALGALSGRHRHQDRETWDGWLRTEARWATRFADLDARAESAEPFEAMEALREVSEHPLYFTRAAQTLARGLAHWDRRVRLRAVEVLERLDCPASVPALIEALMDADLDVSTSARTALVRLTGRDLGSGWTDWNAWWSGR